MTTLETIIQTTVTAAALWGAGLSSYLAWRNFKADKPTMFVTHGWSQDMDIIERTIESSPSALTLHATNTGRQEIVVHILGLEIEGRCCITPGILEDLTNLPPSDKNKDAQHNTRLKLGDSISAAFDLRHLIQLLGNFPGLRIRAYCEDTLENRFLGSWIDMSPANPARRRGTVKTQP